MFYVRFLNVLNNTSISLAQLLKVQPEKAIQHGRVKMSTGSVNLHNYSHTLKKTKLLTVACKTDTLISKSEDYHFLPRALNELIGLTFRPIFGYDGPTRRKREEE